GIPEDARSVLISRREFELRILVPDATVAKKRRIGEGAMGDGLAVRQVVKEQLQKAAPTAASAQILSFETGKAREALEALAARDRDGEVLTAVRHYPARSAKWAEFPEWVRRELRAAYEAKGIARLYSHQAEAAEAVHSGKNIVIVTPTASGKTLCYNLPVLND